MTDHKPGDGKPYVHIGTIGHADHGKTTLAKAIDQYLAARRKQEGSGPRSLRPHEAKTEEGS